MAGRILALCAFAVLVLAAAASAYEFHLLNGMVLRGKLVRFEAGTFHVQAAFGPVTVDADKLDYIIVEPDDAGPDGKAAPGLGLAEPQDAEPVEPPAGVGPMSGMSVPPPPPQPPPGPLPPHPLKARSLERAPEGVLTPGRFRGRP